MDPAFWRDRWQAGKIAFHEGRPNRFLVRHGEWLASCRRILVPLCGKADDLAYLAGQGHEVIGIELVEAAVRQFFDEHEVTPTIEARGSGSIYSAGAITIIAADFFAVTGAITGPIDGVYDRAALVALPDEMRSRYVAHLRAIAPVAQRELLVTLEYPPGSDTPPPFSVIESEVRGLFEGANVRLLDEAPDPRGRAGGQMIERCYSIAYN